MPRAKDPHKMVPVMVRLPPDVAVKLDAERGELSRSAACRSMIERHLRREAVTPRFRRQA